MVTSQIIYRFHLAVHHGALLVHVAREYLNMEVEERPVRFDEIDRFVECGMCGTAAVISPVGKVVDGRKNCIWCRMAELDL